MLWDLFVTFLCVGFVSFGGGYAMIPVIEREVTSRGWMSTQEFTDAIAVAGMSPGPIGTNSAVFVGYHTAGMAGAVSAALGMVVPSLVIVVVVAMFFYKVHKNVWVQSAFYGLRPIVTGLVFYGAIRFARSNHIIADISMETVVAVVLFLAALYALMFVRLHPVYVIALSGLVGIAIYG
ncbi:chromate transporter [Paenibacillus hamazuiensis]|uniref:chromate transporter n=1 Tax=Paenibacillus hamazuiensis TaxID=2936508 RepID=UPI0020101724|nr:chromate transporter [Paenibacillus hamazuiensis]